MNKFVRIYLILLTLGFLVAAILQLFSNLSLSINSSWEFSIGWQREIGIWNVFALCVVTLVIRTNNDDLARLLIKSLLVLFFLLGLNHLVALNQAYYDGLPILIHWIGMLINLAALLLGITVLSETKPGNLS